MALTQLPEKFRQIYLDHIARTRGRLEQARKTYARAIEVKAEADALAASSRNEIDILERELAAAEADYAREFPSDGAD